MSSILTKIKIRADENETEKCMNAKKIGGDGAKADVPKRAALRDLQNRALPRVVIEKNAAQKTLKVAKLAPFVNNHCHWKKAELPTSVATSSSSLRLNGARKAPTTTSSSAANGIQRKGAVAVQSKGIKIVTAEMVEKKLRQVKIISKEKVQSAREIKIGIVEPKSNAVAIKTDVQTKSNEVKETQSVDSYSIRLIKDVRNIDEGDEESLFLVSEYVNDIYEYLFQLEIEQPIFKHHLANQQIVTPKMRAALLDWVNEVHYQFRLVTETFHMAVGIIDRYMQKVQNTSRSLLQLVGVTALFMAAKYEEVHPPAMADLLYMTDQSYNQKQILEMEIQIFRTIDCNLARPVSLQFLRRFAKAAYVQDFQYAMSKYFLELAAIEYELASYKPSEIAAASLFLSLHIFNGDPNIASGFNDSFWNATLQYYSHYTAKHLRPITRKIASIARHAPDAQLNAVYMKYQSSKFYNASLHPALYSALMDSLIENNV